MELYRVLLVDDEEDIREGISRKMDWLGLGFSLVGEAANGQDALELAETLRPDVILTDIKMPFMDGLELCRILTDRLPASRFVVFSGFDAFEYAKQAIQMNVVEYILKPINADELSAVLRRLKEELDRERAERRNMELLRSRYTENLPILRELFYTNLLDGRIEPGTERDRAARLDIDLRGEEWAVGLAYIGSDNSRDALSTLSVQNLLEETLTADRCRLSLYNDWVALIVSLTEAFTIYDLIRSLDRACTLAASYLGLTLTVGVGAPCRELSGMARSSAEARTALEYRSMVGRGQVIYIGDLEPDGGPVLSFEEADERALTAAIKLGNEEEIRQAAAALAGKIRQANPAAGQYHLFLMELVTHLLKMTRRSGVGVEEVFGTDFSLPMQEPALPALAELEDCILGENSCEAAPEQQKEEAGGADTCGEKETAPETAPEAPEAAPAPAEEPEPEKEITFSKKVITERDIIEANRDGVKVIRITERNILTALAKDAASARNIRLVRE